MAAGKLRGMNLLDTAALAPPVFMQGLVLCLGLIVAIGAQNAFVLRQGLRREHVGSVVLFCALADAVLITAGRGAGAGGAPGPGTGLGAGRGAVPGGVWRARAAPGAACQRLAGSRGWRAPGPGRRLGAGRGGHPAPPPCF